MSEKIVIALGGNALQSGKGEPTAEAQLAVVRKTCEHIAEISGSGYEIAVVHGNGCLLYTSTAKINHLDITIYEKKEMVMLEIFT